MFFLQKNCHHSDFFRNGVGTEGINYWFVNTIKHMHYKCNSCNAIRFKLIRTKKNGITIQLND